jgi:hypothetical protein
LTNASELKQEIIKNFTDCMIRLFIQGNECGEFEKEFGELL